MGRTPTLSYAVFFAAFVNRRCGRPRCRHARKAERCGCKHVAVGGLDQMLASAGGERALAIVVNRVNNNGDVGGFRRGERVEHVIAAHVGKIDVEHDQARMQQARERDALFAGAGDADGKAQPHQRARGEVAGAFFVVDDKHGAVAALTGGRGDVDAHRRCLGGDGRRQAQREASSLCQARSSTVTSPPSNSMVLRVMASPKPVPPKRRAVVASACTKALNSRDS